MDDLLMCRSCTVPPHFNCISFKECPCGRWTVISAPPKARSVFVNNKRKPVLMEDVWFGRLLYKEGNFGLTQLRSCISNIHQSEDMFRLLHVNPSSGLTHKNTQRNVQFHSYCVLTRDDCINPLQPNDLKKRPTAQLTSRCCILYIYSTNIRTEYFKHAA